VERRKGGELKGENMDTRWRIHQNESMALERRHFVSDE
jgi:hypothetical protein